MALLPNGDMVTHPAGPNRIYALKPGGIDDAAVLEVVSTRPPGLGHTLKASASRDRLFLDGGVPGAEYEVRAPRGVVVKVKAVHDGQATGPRGGLFTTAVIFDVPPVGVMFGSPERPWRPGIAVEQSPEADLPWGFNWKSRALELGPGVVLAESVWKEADGISAADVGHDAYLTQARVTGGTDGEDYKLTNRIRFSDGTIDQRTITIRIRPQ